MGWSGMGMRRVGGPNFGSGWEEGGVDVGMGKVWGWDSCGGGGGGGRKRVRGVWGRGGRDGWLEEWMGWGGMEWGG